MLIHQIDRGWICKLPTSGFEIPNWKALPAFSIVKTPIHLAAEVVDVAGRRVSPFHSSSVPEPAFGHKRNISETIVGWRLVMMMTLGCALGSEESPVCDGELLPINFYHNCPPSFRLHPWTTLSLGNIGPGGSPVYVLDLTPLYRQFPRGARLGLDPRLASWSGIPEADPAIIRNQHHSSTHGGWSVTSDPLGAPPWEAALFGATPKTGELKQDCAIPTLLWRRVFALGHHVEWTRQGLRMMLPPRGMPSALFPEEVKQETLEKDGDEVFYDTIAANTTILVGAQQQFRYPLLVFRLDPAVTGSTDGAAYTQGINIGMSGRLGWLGVSAIGLPQSLLGFTQVGVGLPTLEVFAVINPQAVEGIWEDSASIQAGALEQLPSAHSAALDEKVMFWGTWGDIDSQQGLSPPALSGVGGSEVPLAQLGVPTLQDAVPNHPLHFWNEAEATLERPLPASVLHDMKEIHSDFHVIPFAMAVMAWEELVKGSFYGSSVYSYEVALWEPGGFAMWPGETASLASRIEEDLASEKVVLIPGGCVNTSTTVFGSLFCK